jgi:DNA-nicking Smr family endonuclease
LDKKQKPPSSNNASDDDLFRQALEGVVPLQTPARSDSRLPRRRVGQRVHESAQELQDSDLELAHGNHAPHDLSQETNHRKNGVQLKVMQKLKRGRFPVEDSFDLHNLGTHDAKVELLKFIGSSRRQGLQCIRVIHGKGLRSKGQPLIKLMTRQILREHPQVLAYTACKPNDGGDGASDVLLRMRGSDD